MGPGETRLAPADGPLLAGLDRIADWARANSLWPLFFGLSCCFIEQATAFTSRYDLGRFGAEVLRGSPRQADLLVVSGTIFKKIAPVVLRLYEQMSEPRWVVSMGSCANTGGMYDAYSVVQGVDQLLPVDVYVPGCPPRPEALMHGLTVLQKKIRAKERPARPILGLAGGSQGSTGPVLADGRTKDRDPRGTGYAGTRLRGSSVTPPGFAGNRAELMWTPPAAIYEPEEGEKRLARELAERFGTAVRPVSPTSDMPIFEVSPERLAEVLGHLKTESAPRYRRLEDLTAVDESARRERSGYPDFHLVYTLTSLDTAGQVRLKVPLHGDRPAAPSITGLWPAANWYEREVYDMFGIGFTGHPNLTRLLMPAGWQGHPLLKSHPHRATDMAAFTPEDARAAEPPAANAILGREVEPGGMVLNIGPHHYSTHGIVRFVLALDGEEIRDVGTEIGFHHRAAEKIAEHQSWHQFLPYTDRVDYLSGAANNLSYLTALETLTGTAVPERAQVIRVMLCELFRLSNHLLWFGTFVQDLGMMSAVFYAFREREMIMDVVELITGARLHPAWFRLGGLAADLPEGWRAAVDEIVRVFPGRIDEYESLFTKNPIFKARTQGIGVLSTDEALDWGVTGPNLRACGVSWDLRRNRPYGAYPAVDFELATSQGGDAYARYLVRLQEMRQSVRIIAQAADMMPEGRVKSADCRYGLPDKAAALTDIESLIHHFVHATRGPAVPRGEAYAATEAPRGEQGYYLVSDGLTCAYRLHVRSPGYANLQILPMLCRGHMLADFVAILGSLDYVMPDIDR